MKIEDVIVARLWRVEAFDGLPLSSAFWNDSLEFQNRHRQLHGRVMHRPGIVYGLEVVPSADGTKVIVAPGVGIDSEGDVVVLDRPRTYPIKEEGRRYILIYRQVGNPDGN